MSTPSSEVDNLEELGRQECLDLLGCQTVGRLAVSRVEDAPLVVPVNFVLRGDEILFRTGSGTKLNLSRGALVSFQVDGFDPLSHTGWSVLATGRAYEATHWEIDHRHLEAWASGPKDHWVRIVIGQVSGRRIRPELHGPLDGRGYL